jgi:hypothetical protein
VNAAVPVYGIMATLALFDQRNSLNAIDRASPSSSITLDPVVRQFSRRAGVRFFAGFEILDGDDLIRARWQPFDQEFSVLIGACRSHESRAVSPLGAVGSECDDSVIADWPLTIVLYRPGQRRRPIAQQDLDPSEVLSWLELVAVVGDVLPINGHGLEEPPGCVLARVRTRPYIPDGGSEQLAVP